MTDLLQRLKQRRIVQWALAYAAAAFALLQGVDIVAQRFAWPESIERILIIVLCIGFFVTLLLAWYHGERGAQKVSGTELLILSLVLALGGGFLWKFAPNAPSPAVAAALARPEPASIPAAAAAVASDNKSIAVLPFENLSADKDNEYFASGMQDMILTKLSAIGDLKVISRTSTEKYASHPDNLKTIAQQLGVATILEGSVQKSGKSVLINVQLIDAANDHHLWADAYPRTLDNIFGVEGEVAQKVADALKAKLTPTEATEMANVPTQNAEAYDLYLRALAFSNHANDQYGLTPVLVPQAIDLLNQAIAKDPKFALASALLARAHMYMYFFGPDRTDVRLKAAKDAADRALSLQPGLGEGHFALGFYWYWGFRDYARAQQEIDLARKTMPHNYDVEEISAAVSRRQGHWQQTLEGLQRAQQFDPRNSSPALELGQTYAQLRRYAEADRGYARAAELSADPALSQIHRAQNTVLWTGDLAPLRATHAALVPGSDAYRSTRSSAFDLAWWSRDFGDAARIAEESSQVTWTSSRGNSVLPRLLRLAWAEEAMGESAKAKALYADIYRDYQVAVRERPGDWDRHMTVGLAAAGLGLKDMAIAEGRRAVTLLPISRDAFAGPEYLGYLAQIYVRVGENEPAIAILKQLMSIPAGLSMSAAMLKLDPVWDPLRKDPRFQKLIADGEAKQARGKP
jgi:serine/threonine-protein kinase